ncbi:ABC-three component system protein, partial [Amycolatopsis sp. NPDC051061]|uniref:ABC-three component system protein n=1 Tax=Amycolatopsis sp. NPDC051061 TaxID=3155042 RepID=UPI0034129747
HIFFFFFFFLLFLFFLAAGAASFSGGAPPRGGGGANDNLLRPGELGRYERRLVEEWSTRFDVLCDELGEQAAEEDKVREARAIYRWVEQEARFRIRPGCDEPFVTKGSYQILADDLRVGWHPDFQARLMALLEPVSGG